MHSLLAPIDAQDEPIVDRARELSAAHLRDGTNVIDESFVASVNHRFGTDLATAVLYVHFEMQLLAQAGSGFGLQRPSADRRPLLIAIAPGAFYKQHPEIGADGRELMELAQQNDWYCEQIPTESLGTLEQNAIIIKEYLRRKTRKYRVVLVSLSKGTSDAKFAHTLSPDLLNELSLWVNVSGVAHGTRMADWLLDRWRLRPVCRLMLWYHGADRQAVSDLRSGSGQPLDETWSEPSFPLIHISAFPLRRHLSCWRSRLWHRRFRAQGPNDSVVMLRDMFRLPGLVLPIWGADHYMQSQWNVAAAVSRIVALLEGAVPSEDDKAA